LYNSYNDIVNHHDLQKILFGEVVFDDDFYKIAKLQNDDFKNAKIYKIYKDINDVVYIGSTCGGTRGN
jgi:hypothetical protein